MTEAEAEVAFNSIEAEIESLTEDNFTSGSLINGLPGSYRRKMIFNRRYWVYFTYNKIRRTFRVWRIWPTRQYPLTPDEIRP